MPDSPAPDQVAAYLTRVRALNELWSYATKADIAAGYVDAYGTVLAKMRELEAEK